jgi:hypothetical protein
MFRIEKDATNNPSLCLARVGGEHIQTSRLMGGISEAYPWDGLSYYYIKHTKFNKERFTDAKVNRNGDRKSLEPLPKFPAFYGTRKIITAFTRALQVRGSSRTFVTILFLLWQVAMPMPKPANWRVTPCPLFADAYSMNPQLPSTAGGRVLHLQPEDVPCCGDRDQSDKGLLQESRLNCSNLPKYTASHPGSKMHRDHRKYPKVSVGAHDAYFGITSSNRSMNCFPL